MAVLDRSWYGRVLVERVEGFATKAEWKRAYGEIADFEKMLGDEGAVIVKLWLHISDEEQLARFEARRDDPLKSYKLTQEDWRNRGKRREYTRAVEDMLERTSTEWAPWHVVEGDSKRYARVKVIETVIAATEAGLERHGRRPPPGG
jgi:AMP-polyphosphate phosphotransferase